MTKQELDKFENALKEQGYELSYQIQIESESYSYYKSFKSYLVFFLIYDFSNTLGERIPKNVLYAITPHIIYGDMDGQSASFKSHTPYPRPRRAKGSFPPSSPLGRS